jgi:serine/threonine-protein kinase
VLAPGDLVAGKYRIERLLGEGGMGAVFVAVNEKLKKRVALKILRAEVARSPGAAERFTREAIAASSAKHPGVIEIYDADVHDGLPWIAMELLEGETLGARVERGSLPLDEVLAIACEALAALAHVHRAGIIHRDLKPDNLFLEALPDGGRRVKILDFGIAASSGAELARVTQTGMAVGTPAYFAPEQAAGVKDLDGRVDVYAMGVILFELITGHLPYSAGSIGEMVMRMYTVGPPSLAREAPQVPAGLAALVDMCLAIERDERVQSADALRRGLEGLRSSVAGLASAPITREVAVIEAAGSTPVGNPSFGGAPHVHTPEAFAQTGYAQATPSPVPLKKASGGLGLAAIASALALLLAVAAAAGIGAMVMWRGEPTSELASSSSVAPAVAPPAVAPPAVAPVLVAPELPPMEPIEAPVAIVEPVERTPPVEAPAAPPPRPRTERRPPPPVAPPAPPPQEAAREPSPLANATIVRVLESNEAALDRCYFDAYPERPRPRVRTEVDLTISSEGRVTESSVVGAHPLLNACAQRVLSQVRFPAHPHSTRARFPMTFHDEP